MGIINKSPRVSSHACVVPPIHGNDIGTRWKCVDCNTYWRMSEAYAEGQHFVDWNRIKNGKLMSPLRPSAYPQHRHPEPTKLDMHRTQIATSMLVTVDLPTSLLRDITIANSSAYAPYHNSQHLIITALNAYDGALNHDLSREESADLILASLFHDFNHTMNQLASDAENIERAIEGLKVNVPAELLTPDRSERVVALIKSTLFPHVEPKSIAEMIIQDADMMTMLEADWATFINGLSIETGRIIQPTQDARFKMVSQLKTQWAKDKFQSTRVMGL